MLGVALEIQGNDSVCEQLVVVPCFKTVHVLLGHVQCGLDRPLSLLLHPLELFPEIGVIFTYVTNVVNVAATVSASIVMDVVVIVLSEWDLNVGLRHSIAV